MAAKESVEVAVGNGVLTMEHNLNSRWPGVLKAKISFTPNPGLDVSPGAFRGMMTVDDGRYPPLIKQHGGRITVQMPKDQVEIEGQRGSKIKKWTRQDQYDGALEYLVTIQRDMSMKEYSIPVTDNSDETISIHLNSYIEGDKIYFNVNMQRDDDKHPFQSADGVRSKEYAVKIPAVEKITGSLQDSGLGNIQQVQARRAGHRSYQLTIDAKDTTSLNEAFAKLNKQLDQLSESKLTIEQHGTVEFVKLDRLSSQADSLAKEPVDLTDTLQAIEEAIVQAIHGDDSPTTQTMELVTEVQNLVRRSHGQEPPGPSV